ncbi:TetR/AcrR family transcriptional regulator C-terminal domain-containing protein, partial [Streptomyces clavuligerus]|uniref:TetR/AcrR family transcriptional regulator C-terminal domain-containing protein n=2 Tax=Streptomyces clavuligerus TaxID=1901 RepID=UPI001E5F90A9
GGRPARLDPERTVTVALDLLDEVGLDALTMRRLAEAMGVRAGALYRYFATKHDLLTAMAERILAEHALPAAESMASATSATSADSASVPEGPAGEWDERAAALAYALRGALLAHRDGARVYAGTHSFGPGTLGFADALVGVVREAGLDDPDAARGALAIVHFTLGHTLEEQAARGGAPDARTSPERLRAAVGSDDRHPHLRAVLPTLAAADFEAHFAFGLRLVLDGLRTHRRRL